MSSDHPQGDPFTWGLRTSWQRNLNNARVLIHKQGMFCDLKVSPMRAYPQRSTRHIAVVTPIIIANTHTASLGPSIVLVILHKLTHLTINNVPGKCSICFGCRIMAPHLTPDFSPAVVGDSSLDRTPQAHPHT